MCSLESKPLPCINGIFPTQGGHADSTKTKQTKKKKEKKMASTKEKQVETEKMENVKINHSRVIIKETNKRGGGRFRFYGASTCDDIQVDQY